MKQIVFNGQKPKYCNLVAITTGSMMDYVIPINEIWLVDSTNSSKPNGKGRYDSYIVGDGIKPANALVIHDIGDKEYMPSEFSGFGKRILCKNIVNNKNILTQAMVNTANTIYHIQYDYDLNGDIITLPAGCVLKFDGGSVKNGTLIGTSSVITSNAERIFGEDITIQGLWDNNESFPEWFGAIGDGASDDTLCIQKTINSFPTATMFLTNNYNISTIEVPNYSKIRNNGIVYTNGNGFVLQSGNEFSGGRIQVAKNAVGITLGKLDSSTNRRTSINNIIITGTKDGDYGIKCIASPSYYNTFCHINNVTIYRCFYGFYGNIRASLINIAIEQCYQNMYIYGNLNIVNIIGQAGVAHQDYNAFIYIDGNKNIINANIYDIGANSTYQQYLVSSSEYNIIQTADKLKSTTEKIKTPETILSSDYNETALKSRTAYIVENPQYSYELTNITCNYDLSVYNLFNHSVYKQNWFSFSKVDDSADGYLTLTFPNLTFIMGFSIELFSAGERIVVESYFNDTLYNKVTNDSDILFIPYYYTGFNSRQATLKVVIKIPQDDTRILGFCLFAINAPKLNFGNTASRPSPLFTHVGFKYFDTSISMPVYWNGNKWVDSKGMTAGKHSGNVFDLSKLLLSNGDIGYEYFVSGINKMLYASRIDNQGKATWIDCLGQEMQFNMNYVTNGLVFCLDGIMKGNDSNSWLELVNNILFSGTDVVSSNKGWIFNGTSSSFFSDYQLRGTENYTIEVCFKVNELTSPMFLFASNGSASNNVLFNYNSGTVTFLQRKNTYPITLNSGGKYSISLNLTSGLCNGVSVQINEGTSNYSNSNFWIGRRDTGGYFNGEIYAIRLYNRRLTAEEQMANYLLDNERFELSE